MNGYDALKELEQFPEKLKAIDDAHSSALAELDRRSKSDMQTNRSGASRAEAELTEIEKNIKKLESKLSKQVEECFTKQAISELSALLEGVDAKPNYLEGSIQKTQQDLVFEHGKAEEVRVGKIGGLKKQGENIGQALSRNIARENEEHDAKVAALIQDAKAMYARYASGRLEPYALGSEPNVADGIPEEVNLGDAMTKRSDAYLRLSAEKFLRLPLLVNIKEGSNGNIVLKVKRGDVYEDDLVERTLVGMTMRYLESFPAGTLKVGVFGSVFSSMQRLSALYSAIVKGGIAVLPQAATNQQELSKLLSAINVRGGIINQKLLENECPDIFGLYDRGVTTEPFQLVILQGAFKDISEENLNTLYGCISGQYNCGVRFLIVDDFDEETYKNRSDLFKMTLAQIERRSTSFLYDAKNSKTENGISVELASVPKEFGQQSVYDFCKKYSESVGKKKARALTYERIGFGQDSGKKDWNSISIPVGLEDPDVWNIELNCLQNPPIANLVIGVPGTGKSTLIDAMILNGAIKYSPDELVFQLLDFKDGVSSSVYTMEECKIPHVKVISQNNKPEEASIILYNIMTESERRNDAFKALSRESGKQIRNIAEYNQLVVSEYKDRRQMPRLVIIIDECQYLFEDDALAKTCEDIVRKCRSQGIHLILATQTLSRKMWSTIKFVDGRYCFEIAKEDAEQLLDRKYIPLISTEVPKGSYMAFASNNSGQDCHKIKIAYDCGKMSDYAKAIREKWKDYPIELVEIGDKSAFTLSSEEYKNVLSKLPQTDGFLLPLGENYTDHSLVTAEFRNEKQSAMLLLGTRQHLADGMFTAAMLAADRAGLDVYAVDASRDQSMRDFLPEVGKNVTYTDENGYLSVLSDVFKLYETRMENLRATYKPVLFLINAAQNISAFVNDEKPQQDDAPEPAANPLMRLMSTQAARSQPRQGVAVTGRASLFNLLSNAYKVNIFLIFGLDSLMATSDSGEPVFGFQQKNILRNNTFKALYHDVSDSQSVMEDSFKEKMMNGMSEHMAILSVKQKFYFKFRVFELYPSGGAQ